MRLTVLALALALQGCGANYVVSASSSTATTTATAAGSGPLFLAVMLGVMSTQESSLRPVPDMSPTRTINEQDCTKPISFTGNLKCR